MSEKIKTISERLSTASKQLGYVILAGAATFGMIDMPNRLNSRIVLPSQPAFAFAGNNASEDQNNSIRREREEVAPHYISYSEVQRTASRSGKV